MAARRGSKEPVRLAMWEEAPEDLFKSGLRKENPHDKLARNKALGLHMDIFNQQDSFGISISTDDFDCEACAILGSRGQGKSNTLGRIVEQIIPKTIGMTIMDIEGEYYSLKSRYNVLVVGSGAAKYYDLQFLGPNAVKPQVLAEIAVKKKLVVVLDFSDVDEAFRVDFCNDYIEALMGICTVLKNENKPTQHIVVIEEVQEYAPEEGPMFFGDGHQNKLMSLKKQIKRLATRGRKRGVGMIIASQRTAQVDKTLLSQCETKILHKVTLPNDMSVYERIMCGWLDTKELRENIMQMVPGDCFAYFGDDWHRAHVLPQDTVHLGYSPKLSYAGDDVPDFKGVDKELVKEILCGSSSLDGKIRSPYQKTLDDLNAEIARLTNRNSDLSRDLTLTQRELAVVSKLSIGINAEELVKAMVAISAMNSGSTDPDVVKTASSLKSQFEKVAKDNGPEEEKESGKKKSK